MRTIAVTFHEQRQSVNDGLSAYEKCFDSLVRRFILLVYLQRKWQSKGLESSHGFDC